jgi:hypothetical protein
MSAQELAEIQARIIEMAAQAETAGGRRDALKRGLALPPPGSGAAPGFPVTDADHWEKAFRAVGRAGSPARRAALGDLLRKTAARFGKTGRIKGSWLDTSGGSKDMSNTLNLAMMKCPSCGYQADDAEFSISGDASGTDVPRAPGTLQTPDSGNGLGSMSAAAGMNPGQIGLSSIDLARRSPVGSASDVLVSRGENGRAVVRHRRGGSKIGEIFRMEDGQYTSTLGDEGKQLQPHTRQRGALHELISTWNTGAGSMYHRPQGTALVPPPAQTPLMRQFGVPAVSALATPSNGDSDGPRVTSSGDDLAGLSPKGITIYRKLRKRMPADRALTFARRAQDFGNKGS